MRVSGAARARGWLISLGLVVVASIAVATAPQSGTLGGPFVRTGVQGEVVHGRVLAVEVTGVRAGEQLNLAYDETRLDTDGVWVVVDLIVTSSVDLVQLTVTELRIDGIAYRVRELPYPDMTFTSYGPGVPVQGSIAFELPASALEGDGLDDARIRFQYSTSVQLDDIPEVIVDLTGIDVARSESIDAPVILAVR